MTSTNQTQPDTRADYHVMTVGKNAVDVIAACNERVESLGQFFGYDSTHYREAEQSYRRNLSKLFGMFFGATSQISRDGELSLYVSTETKFVFGMIFHSVRRCCTNAGCKAQINDDGKAWVYMPDYPMCNNHAPSYPLDAPTPGSWSFHS